jgi:hypothetical protein
MSLLRHPFWQYPHYWWWRFRQLVHERHIWHVEALLFHDDQGRVWLQGGSEEHGPSTGAIERCICGKSREVEYRAQ